jgi:alanine-synthesizing transaminase
MEEFQRISRLPPYVFNIVNELKAKARADGEDIIDFGMGNPDQPTPPHIVKKMIEVAEREDTHRYSVSKGIPRLRKAICTWYKNRFDVDLDFNTEAIVTIGSKEGFGYFRTWRCSIGTEPGLSDSSLWRSHRRRGYSPCTIDAGCRFF